MHKKYNDVTNVAMFYSKMSVKMSTFISQKTKLVWCYSGKWQVFKWRLSGELSRFFELELELELDVTENWSM